MSSYTKFIIFTVLFTAVSTQAAPIEKLIIGPSDRPAQLKLPSSGPEDSLLPLVILLHGRAVPPWLSDIQFGLSRNQKSLGYALLLPKGHQRASDGKSIWNATPQCCGDDNDPINDSIYLKGLVEEALAKYPLDPRQVFVFGHSNGGFMAYRLACDHPQLFTGIISVAGATFGDESMCKNTAPINILQIHGTDDPLVLYEGEDYPAAELGIARFAQRLECQSYTETPRDQNLRFFTAEPGLNDEGRPVLDGKLQEINLKADTDSLVYETCLGNSKVGLWRIQGARHAPIFIGRDVIRKSLEFVGYQK